MNWVSAIGSGAKVSRGKIYRIINIDVETRKSVIVFQDSDAWFAINRLRDQIKNGECIIGLWFVRMNHSKYYSKKKLRIKAIFC